MIYVGIDPSVTSTGLVAIDGGGKVLCARAIKPAPSLKGLVRVRDIRHQVMQDIRSTWMKHANSAIGSPLIVVAIEAPAYACRAFTVAQLVELGTALRLAIHDQGWTYYDVAPTALKAFAGMKAKDKKLKPVAEVKALWGFEHKSTDVIDAYVLARIAKSTTATLDTTPEQRQVLMALRQGMQ